MLIRDILAAAGDRSVLLITHRPEGLENSSTRSHVELRAGLITRSKTPSARGYGLGPVAQAAGELRYRRAYLSMTESAGTFERRAAAKIASGDGAS